MPLPAGVTNTEALGRVLYTDYIFFFQIAGLVLLVAMIGAIVLTLRHRPGVQAPDRSRARSRATPRRRGRAASTSSRGRGAERWTIGLAHYLIVAALLFTIGVFGIFLNRKNVIIILMSIELILLAVNINLVAFSAFLRRPDGPGLRAVRADRRRRRGRHRPRHPRRLFPQPRHHRGRRRQSDEGLSVRCTHAIVFLPAARLRHRRAVRPLHRRARCRSSSPTGAAVRLGRAVRLRLL